MFPELESMIFVHVPGEIDSNWAIHARQCDVRNREVQGVGSRHVTILIVDDKISSCSDKYRHAKSNAKPDEYLGEPLLQFLVFISGDIQALQLKAVLKSYK